MSMIHKFSMNGYNIVLDVNGGAIHVVDDVVKQLVEYGRKVEKDHNKNIRFTMTTNGVLLDYEKIAYINEHMHNAVLTLDGKREINDKGSYDIILPKFKKLIESRTKDVMHFSNEGFASTSIEPII